MAIDLTSLQDPLGLGRVGYAQPALSLTARQWTAGSFTERGDQIVEETPVALVYNGAPHVVMMATPQDLEDFAVGFSCTEELVRSAADVKAVEVVRYGQGIELQVTIPPECEAVVASRNRRMMGRTGCGICGSDSIQAVLREVRPIEGGPPSIAAAAVQTALAALPGAQPLNTATGAVHAAAWASPVGAIELVREDVGRHNALDKLIGALLRRGTDPQAGFLVVTSRASFEMVQKATVFGAPLLAAISGPTGLAVRLAQQAGLTLVGFARPDRLTVYTHPQRLTA